MGKWREFVCFLMPQKCKRISFAGGKPSFGRDKPSFAANKLSFGQGKRKNNCKKDNANAPLVCLQWGLVMRSIENGQKKQASSRCAKEGLRGK
ncbi:hypothetical protein [Alloprevotella tannerae]|uniref:hypothetical protein n=1 Tax=Alloprevotella tannerae TaxID=76122 RepID=UPI0028D72CDA|nr:hypothetical protein [Alloprevotella tannerae]